MKALRATLHALAASCCLLALAACGGDTRLEFIGGSPDDTDNRLEGAFVATLDAAPGVTPSEAAGAATLDVDPSTRRIVAIVTLDGTTADSVAVRAPGLSQNVVLPLAETPPSSGVWSASATLSADQFSALRAGELFILATSQAFPGGELRGDILPQQTGAVLPLVPQTGASLIGMRRETVALMSTLSGAAVVPAADTAGRGAAAAIVDPDTRVLEVALATAGTVPTEVTLNLGTAGSNGETVLALEETLAASGVWFGRAVLDQAQLDALLAGEMHLLARSAAFPDGELRGQLLPQRQAPGFRENAADAPATPPGTSSFTGDFDGGAGIFGIGFGSSGMTDVGTTGFGASGTDGTGFTIPGSNLTTTPGSIGLNTTPLTPGSIGLGTGSQPTSFSTPLPGLNLNPGSGAANDPFSALTPLAPDSGF